MNNYDNIVDKLEVFNALTLNNIEEEPDPNESCLCGSGIKYKKCALKFRCKNNFNFYCKICDKSYDYFLEKGIRKHVLNRHRIKHYIKRDKIILYNEKDIGSNKYSRLRLKVLNIPKNLNDLCECGSGKKYKKCKLRFKCNDYKNNFQILRFKGQIKITKRNSGIEDPRIIFFNNKYYSICNGLDRNLMKNMYICDLVGNKLVKLWINNFDISNIKIQKNWTPYVYNNNLYFIYAFSKLTVLKLIDISTGECECVSGNPLKFNDEYSFFGGTPLIHWNTDCYIGFAHSRKPYRCVPLMYNPKKMEMIRVGNPITFSSPPNITREIYRNEYRKGDIQFPYDLYIKDDTIILSIEFDDCCSGLLHLNYKKFINLFN